MDFRRFVSLLKYISFLLASVFFITLSIHFHLCDLPSSLKIESRFLTNFLMWSVTHRLSFNFFLLLFQTKHRDIMASNLLWKSSVILLTSGFNSTISFQFSESMSCLNSLHPCSVTSKVSQFSSIF